MCGYMSIFKIRSSSTFPFGRYENAKQFFNYVFLVLGEVGVIVLTYMYILQWDSQVVLVVKNLPANAGEIRDLGSIPGSGRTPGEGNGNPLQCSCLENPRDRGAWRATVHGAARVPHDLATEGQHS